MNVIENPFCRRAQRLCEADIRRAVMIPEQLSKVDSCSPDVERLQRHGTESVLLANAVQGKM